MNKFINNLPESIGGSIDPVNEFPIELQLADKVLTEINRTSGGADAHNLDAFELAAATALANVIDIESADSTVTRNVFHMICLHIQARAVLGYLSLETMDGYIAMPDDVNAQLKKRSGVAEVLAESFVALHDFFADEGRKYESKLWRGLATSCMKDAMLDERAEAAAKGQG